MPYHRLLNGENVHALDRWNFADETARTTASGVVAADVGKLAWQTDDDSFWMLTDESPLTWVSFTGGGDSPFITMDSGFTAVPFGRYAIDVSTSPLTILLPEIPTEGDWFEFYDATANSDTNTITLDGNTNNLMGSTDDITIITPGLYFKIVYFNVAGGYRVMRLV